MGPERLPAGHGDLLHKYTVRIRKGALLSGTSFATRCLQSTLTVEHMQSLQRRVREYNASSRLHPMQRHRRPILQQNGESIGEWGKNRKEGREKLMGNADVIDRFDGAGVTDTLEVDVYFMPHVAVPFYKEKLRLIAPYYTSLVIVANIGAHANNAATLKAELADMLQFFRGFTVANQSRQREWPVSSVPPSQHLVFMRETSAQHFDSSNGYFTGGSEWPFCVPLSGDQMWDAAKRGASAVDWRNKLLREALESINADSPLYPSSASTSTPSSPPAHSFAHHNSTSAPLHLHLHSTSLSLPPTIHLIPFWRYTAPLWDFHQPLDLVPLRSAFGKVKPDCTHFGYSPLLVQPILREISRVILHFFE